MSMRKAQQGMTLMGMIIGLAVAGVFIFVGMKVFPMYSEFWSIKSALDDLSETPKLASESRGRILDLLARRFTIDYVDSVKITQAERNKGEKIFLETKGGITTLTIKYEVRKSMAYNLDVVGKFEHSVTLSN